ncbi:YhcH/YjgK/YiaL family protein [Serratia aquatilis]|uniref:YhcH/YjgK/YiaL family protein n=1 Tax=Serratia aquatilis TaxID=1737515 RepID=A0ABV6EE66_9GAMM
MITANINDYKTALYLSEQMKDVISKALEITASNPADGRYNIDGDSAFVLISSPMTEAHEKRLAEIHHKYLDVQILLAGKEVIGYGTELAAAAAVQDLLADKDIAFYNAIPNEQFVSLNPGDYAVFYPHELHRPLCSAGQEQQIKKAVVKIKIDYLK